MGHKKVTFVTLDILPQLAPLTGGYLQGYACLDPGIRDTWQFEHYVAMAATRTSAQLLAAMHKADADVYAFSCYAWNTGLVRAVLPDLLDAKPNADFILGGPQVMNCADRYLSPRHERLVLCNGEGEKTFRAWLRELTGGTPDLSRVKGLSFYRDGQIVTTAPEDRIRDLDEIPSPFLDGLFDPRIYSNVVIETNRGCPFTCTYCYWGGATGAKVNKFSQTRIEAEFEWIASNSINSLSIVDANWGILERDVELTRLLSRCKERYGTPRMVGFSASKNTPERVAEITKIFHDGGLLLSHTISLQTMQDTTLKKIGRQNIKTKAYVAMQRYMNELGISSHVELIWPLPGETLETFILGVDQLCKLGADLFYCHPLFLINNVEMNLHREEYGLVAVPFTDPGSEAEVVVATKEVSRADCLAGWRFMFATVILHNLRSTHCLARHLHDTGAASYGELYAAFARFLQDRPTAALSQIIEESIPRMTLDAFTLGRIGCYLHEAREAFDQLLLEFVSSQPWWRDEAAQLWFEIDLLNRPSLFHPEIRTVPQPVRRVHVLSAQPDGYLVEIPAASLEQARSYLGAKATFRGGASIRIDHKQSQFLHVPSSRVEVQWMQCYQSAFNIVQISPTWRDAAA